MDFLVGGKLLLTPTMRLAVTGSFANKDAKARYNAYEGLAVQTVYTWLLGRGQFLAASYTFGENEYDTPDRAISAKTRRDEQHRARVTYGLPVSLVTGRFLPKIIVKDLTFAVTFEQFRSDSNVKNYTYSNSKVSGMFTKTFDF